MSLFVVRLPDVGEGVAEAELVAWHVVVGEVVTPDTVVAEVLTDKATVEIYAPVGGTIVSLNGTAGDVLAVGSDFIGIEIRDSTTTETPVIEAAVLASPAVPGALAAPAVRERARGLDVDLAEVAGSGPDGRVTHNDLDRQSPATKTATTTEIPIIGLRRKIAEHLTTSSSRIPHITYVDEIDMTQLEHLRISLAGAYPDQPRLTVLPFIMCAIVRAVSDHSHVNATFDDEAQLLTTYDAVHIGIATQTPQGLIVPVVHDAHTMDVWRSAQEMERVTTAARTGTAKRHELTGSTITVTSLGALGGLMTTPIINHPEVAIIGVNKMQTRAVWDGTGFVPRTMMNLSSSFDHRIVDGWLAATFVQRIKALLEEPSLLFIAEP